MRASVLIAAIGTLFLMAGLTTTVLVGFYGVYLAFVQNPLYAGIPAVAFTVVAYGLFVVYDNVAPDNPNQRRF